MYAALSKPKEALLLHVLIFETICQKVYCIVILCYFLLFFTTNVLNITCLHTSRSRVSFQGDPEALTKSCQFELFDGYTQGVRDNEVFVEVKVRTEDPIQPAAPSGVAQHVGAHLGYSLLCRSQRQSTWMLLLQLGVARRKNGSLERSVVADIPKTAWTEVQCKSNQLWRL